MSYHYDPLSLMCKSITGAVASGDTITLKVYKYNESGENSFSAEVCNLVLNQDGKHEKYYQMNATEYGWKISLKFNQVGLYYYYFRIGGKNLARGEFHHSVTCDFNPQKWQLTVYEKNYSTPEWFKGGIMYQIFPDRFYKSGETLPTYGIVRKWGETPYYQPNEEGKVLNNDFFGGNLQGIREKLDYLHQLGVTVLYLNPIFESYSNHHYDTGDYKKIASILGTEDDFKELVKDALKHGIRIILDGVFNHTGDDSIYFNRYGHYDSVGAYQSQSSPYLDWYCFHEYPNRYESWWGIETLPAINENSPSYQNYMFGDDGVMKYWLRDGIGGYRLDVADELPDFFLKKLRNAVKEENPDAIIIGEVWEDASNKIAYGTRREYFQGNELDSVMNYPLKDAIIHFLLSGKTYQLRETIVMLIDHYPKTALDCLMNHLGTHDTSRILTVLGGHVCYTKDEMAVQFLSDEEKQRAKELLKFGVVLQYTLPGVPCIYYGDEAGMEGYSDPFCRKCFDWDNCDCELTKFYEELSDIRMNKLKSAFTDGVYREIYATDTFLMFERKSEKQTAYIYVNRGDSEFNLKFNGVLYDYISHTSFKNHYTIARNSYGILSKKK